MMQGKALGESKPQGICSHISPHPAAPSQTFGGDLWVALVARLMSNTNKTSEDADFFAFPCHVTSFRSWMGRTDRPDKHSSHPAVTLLGTAQASRANFSSSLWVSLVCFVLLPIT